MAPLSFSDSDTTGDSSAEDVRTQSDYDNAWMQQIVNRVDAFMQQRCDDPQVSTSWTAIKNILDMHTRSLHIMRSELNDMETRLFHTESQRARVETHLREFSGYILSELSALNMAEWESE